MELGTDPTDAFQLGQVWNKLQTGRHRQGKPTIQA